MGTAIGERLLDADCELVVHNRSLEKAEPLRARGATVAESAGELAAAVDIVLTSLPDDAAFESVAADVAATARPGTLLVDMSTVSPGASARVAALAERASRLPARAGERQPLASSAPATSRSSSRARKMRSSARSRSCSRSGAKILYVGEGEQARVVKLALHLVIGGIAELLAEALVLGEAVGISRAALLEAMGASAVGSPFVGYKSEPLLRDDYSATFTTAMMVKDVDLVLDARRGSGRHPSARHGAPGAPRAARRGGVRRRRLHGALPRISGTSDSGGAALMPRTRTNASRGATMAVDWEQRIDFDRLRAVPPRPGEGAARGAPTSARSLLFDPNNIRYVTSTHIGEWARDKNARWVLLLARRGPDPLGLRLGCAAPQALRAVAAAGELPRRRRADARRDARRDGRPGPARREDRPRAPGARPRRRAARRRHGRPDARSRRSAAPGCTSSTARGPMLEARKIKSAEEIALLDHACGIVDAVYEEIYRMLRPGRPRARDRRAGPAAAVRARLGARRGDQRRLRRPLQPAPARLLRPAAAARRPGVLRRHPLVHGLPHVLLPHVQRRRRLASRSSTPTSSAASGSTRRSSSCGRARRRTRSRRSGRPRRSSASPTRRAASGSSSGTASASGCTSRR